MRKTVFRLASLICFAMLSVVPGASAQVPTGQPNGTPPSVTLKWTASATASAAYNVYRATATGQESGTPALNGATPVTATTYVDTTVAAGTTYFYVVSATLAGVQSAFSNEVSAPVPTLPAAPVLSGTTISASFNGHKTKMITASYTDTSGQPTAYQLWGGSALLQKGQPAVSANGQYSVTWTGKNGKAPSPSLTVEDAAGNVMSSNQ